MSGCFKRRGSMARFPAGSSISVIKGASGGHPGEKLGAAYPKDSETMKFAQKAISAKAGIVAALLSLSLIEAALAGTPSVEGFRAWIASFRATALEKGIRASTYDNVARWA